MLPLYPRITAVEVRAHFVVALCFNGVDLDPDVLYHKAHFPGDPILMDES